MPESSFLYSLPYEYYEIWDWKYGFHGTSHKYVTQRAKLNRPIEQLRLISCHLGNGQVLLQYAKENQLTPRWDLPHWQGYNGDPFRKY